MHAQPFANLDLKVGGDDILQEGKQRLGGAWKQL